MMTQVAGKSMPGCVNTIGAGTPPSCLRQPLAWAPAPRVNRSLKGNVVREDLRLDVVEGPDALFRSLLQLHPLRGNSLV